MIRFFLLCGVALLCINIINCNESYRLPKTFHPENYRLEIITHLNDEDNFKFYGKVYIRLNCDHDTHNITLHAKNLTIHDGEVKLTDLSDENKPIPVDKIGYSIENDYMIIHSKELLNKGHQYELYIPFEESLNKGLLGYYRSSYVDKLTKEKVWLSVTQFEATHARRAFPCFDEPEFKATFNISLGHHKNYTALSNMPQESSQDMEGQENWVMDHFEETVPMSTYLVAYSINDFAFKESPAESDSNVVFRIWARRDAINQVDYAKSIGPKVLKFYEDYFDIKFPLPKIDMIAIPDFSAGAMENWGLITYRETALLFDPLKSSASSQHRVASVVAHELAHQWFGNLVTMRWWTDLWLNEGFATYVAALGVEHLHPEWNSLEEESVDNTLDIFRFDSLRTSHPVSVEIGHPNQISEIFDVISYNKGSAIIRMMQLFLGEETFRNGVSNYLKKHKYNNAQQSDLWDALTEAAHKNGVLPDELSVKTIMESWTLQTGYPIITVERDYEQNTAELTQVRFLADRKRLKVELNPCWWIPLSWTTNDVSDFNSTMARDWFKCTEKNGMEDDGDDVHTKVISNVTADNWILFNLQLSGLYKVKYDKQNWRLIAKTLNGPDYQKINSINRAQLLDDAMDLAWKGEQDYGIALAMIEYLKQEKEYIPWKSALDNLNSVNRLIKRTPLFGVFKAYMQHILEPIYEKMGGLSVENLQTNRLDAVKHKVLVSAWSCRFDVGDCIEKSLSLFKAWMNEADPDKKNPIPLDLRSVVYCTTIKYRKEKEWEFLWNRYKNSNVGSEKTMIISSLSCTKEIWLLQRYLMWSLNSTSGVRLQDSSYVFGGVARSEIGYHLAKDFLIEHVDDIYNYLAPDTSRLSRYVKPLAEQISSPKELGEIRNLVESKPKVFEKAMQGVRQALETIELNNQWQTNNYQQFSRLMNKNFKNIKSFEDVYDF